MSGENGDNKKDDHLVLEFNGLDSKKGATRAPFLSRISMQADDDAPTACCAAGLRTSATPLHRDQFAWSRGICWIPASNQPVFSPL